MPLKPFMKQVLQIWWQNDAWTVHCLSMTLQDDERIIFSPWSFLCVSDDGNEDWRVKIISRAPARWAAIRISLISHELRIFLIHEKLSASPKPMSLLIHYELILTIDNAKVKRTTSKCALLLIVRWWVQNFQALEYAVIVYRWSFHLAGDSCHWVRDFCSIEKVRFYDMVIAIDDCSNSNCFSASISLIRQWIQSILHCGNIITPPKITPRSPQSTLSNKWLQKYGINHLQNMPATPFMEHIIHFWW